MGKGICSTDGCERGVSARSLCSSHYAHWRRANVPQPVSTEPCSIEGCEKFVLRRGWCVMHYQRWLRHGDPMIALKAWHDRDRRCTIEDCTNKHAGRGYCEMHLARWMRTGDPRLVRSRWDGYVRPPCGVDECAEEARCNGYCLPHASRARRHGDPLIIVRRSAAKGTVEERFLSNIQVDEVGGCWIWKGSCTQGGYGTMCFKTETFFAHRWSHERFIGPIGEGLEVDHLCRVQCCVNPDHLEAVTHAENMFRGLLAVHLKNAGVAWSVPLMRTLLTAIDEIAVAS